MSEATKAMMIDIHQRVRSTVIEVAHHQHGHPAAYDSEVSAFLDHVNTIDGHVVFLEVVREDSPMFNFDNLMVLASKIGLEDLFAEGVASENHVFTAVLRYISQWPHDMARWYEHVDQFFREESE